MNLKIFKSTFNNSKPFLMIFQVFMKDFFIIERFYLCAAAQINYLHNWYAKKQFKVVKSTSFMMKFILEVIWLRDYGRIV